MTEVEGGFEWRAGVSPAKKSERSGRDARAPIHAPVRIGKVSVVSVAADFPFAVPAGFAVVIVPTGFSTAALDTGVRRHGGIFLRFSPCPP
jgi:hypothetical protein